MRKLIRAFILFSAFVLAHQKTQCQEKTVPSSAVTVSGEIKAPFSFTLESIAKLPTLMFDSIPIFNHAMQKRNVFHQVKGVPLKSVLKDIQFTDDNPKNFSEYYFVCTASDGYKVVFSWNELFNTKSGEQAIVITGKNGEDETLAADRIALLFTGDMATGRRYVKSLEKILVLKAK